MGKKFGAFAKQRLAAIGLQRSEAAKRAAAIGGSTAGVFDQIIAGEMACPSSDRIPALARALNLTVEAVQAQLSADGCNYATEAETEAIQENPLIQTVQVVPFDTQGSTGYYPRAAAETIDTTVLPIGTIGLDTHRVAETQNGNISYRDIVYKTITEPFSLESGVGNRGAGRYVDVQIYPDHSALVDKLDVVGTSMFIAVEWEEKPKKIGGRKTLVAKRFKSSKLNSAGDVLAYGGTDAGFALEAACTEACEALGEHHTIERVETDFAVEDESIGDYADRVRQAFYDAHRMPNGETSFWLSTSRIYEDYAIIEWNGANYRAGYEETDGVIVPDPTTEWVKVRQETNWIPVEATATESETEEQSQSSDGNEENAMELQQLKDRIAELEATNKQVSAERNALRQQNAAMAVEARLSKLTIKAGHEYVVEMLKPALTAGVKFSEDGKVDGTALDAAIEAATKDKPFMATETAGYGQSLQQQQNGGGYDGYMVAPIMQTVPPIAGQLKTAVETADPVGDMYSMFSLEGNS